MVVMLFDQTKAIGGDSNFDCDEFIRKECVINENSDSEKLFFNIYWQKLGINIKSDISHD